MKFKLLLAIGIINWQSAFSQELGPHGGNLKACHDYFIEMTACFQYFEVYLYNKAMQPELNSAMSGSVVYHRRDGKEQTEIMNHWGIDGFSVKGSDDFDYCTVKLSIQGRPVTARFENNFKCTDR